MLEYVQYMINKTDLQMLWKRCSGSVYQSWEWAEINRLKGRTPVFLTIEENNLLKASILCFAQKIKTPLGLKTALFSEGTPLYLDARSLNDILLKFKEDLCFSLFIYLAFLFPTDID